VKRSAALAALSRDHHHALDAARRLRRAGAGDLDDAVAHLRAFWEPRGRRHFEIEERLILPALPETDPDWREATARVRDEHGRIRAAVDAVLAPGGDGDGVEAAHALGTLLHDHVRFEERHLFGLLEARVPERELAGLGEAIQRAEATG
jgi:hemerythrin HHE cation binding domain-containing protein